MDKIDPYNHKERYLKWKEETTIGISGINEFDSALLIRYIKDMENSDRVNKLLKIVDKVKISKKTNNLDAVKALIKKDEDKLKQLAELN